MLIWKLKDWSPETLSYCGFCPTLTGWTWTRLGITPSFDFLLVRIYSSSTILFLSFYIQKGHSNTRLSLASFNLELQKWVEKIIFLSIGMPLRFILKNAVNSNDAGKSLSWSCQGEGRFLEVPEWYNPKMGRYQVSRPQRGDILSKTFLIFLHLRHQNLVLGKKKVHHTGCPKTCIHTFNPWLIPMG